MRWYPLFLPATLDASALTLGTEQKADPFKFHSQASSPALTRNRQRLPSCLLIEDVSESGFLPRAPAFGPRHLRSSLSDQRPRNFDLTALTQPALVLVGIGQASRSSSDHHREQVLQPWTPYPMPARAPRM